MNPHLSYAVAALASFVLLTQPAFAQNNVSLDNLTSRDNDTKRVIALARVEVVNTNLTRDELTRLLSGETRGVDAAALLARMTADRLTITGATITNDDSKLTLGPFEAAGIDKGRFATASLAGFSGVFAENSGAGGSVEGRALRLTNGDIAPLLLAIQTDRSESSLFQVGSVAFDGLDARFTDSQTPADAPGGNQFKLRLQSLALANAFNAGLPLSGKIEAVGLVLDPAPSSELGKSLRDFGYERIELGLSGEGQYDVGARKLVVKDYTISSPQAGRLSLSGEMSGVDAAALSSGDPTVRGLALLGSSVERLKIDFVNDGIVEKGFAYAAGKQGKNPTALRAEVASMAVQLLPLLLGGDPQSLALAQAIQTFMTQPRNFSLALQARGAAAPLAQLAAIRDPKTFLALVSVSLTANQ